MTPERRIFPRDLEIPEEFPPCPGDSSSLPNSNDDNESTTTFPVSIVHHDTMSSAFALTEVLYDIDGVTVCQWSHNDEGERSDVPDTFGIFDGSLTEGSHELIVHLEYRNVPVGPGYVLSYRFRIASRHQFDMSRDRSGRLLVIPFEAGGPITPIEERPALRYVWEE